MIPQKKMMRFWTPERIDTLEAQWAAGASVRLIASRLGCTRNTVIGKANRMDLPIHIGSALHPDAERKRAENKEKAKAAKSRAPRLRVRRVAPGAGPVAPSSMPPQPSTPGLAPVPLRLPLVALEAWQCRYSVTAQAPHVFCGHPRQGKSGFCAFHHALCYEPVRARSDVKRGNVRSFRKFARAA
jgi:GcrA cell cycle regulator